MTMAYNVGGDFRLASGRVSSAAGMTILDAGIFCREFPRALQLRTGWT